jgi:hypothetical protein
MLLPDSVADATSVDVLRLPTTRALRPHAPEPEGELLAIWEGGAAQEALRLAAAVPPGELYRCFTPGYGIRAFRDREELFEVRFCFSCHGAQVRQHGSRLPLQGFDADTPEAQALLARFREAAAADSGQRG